MGLCARLRRHGRANSLGSLPVSASEQQRRRRLIQHLQNTSTSGSVPMDSSSNLAPGDSAQQSQMSLAMQQQDDLIDELATGVGRLKNQTQLIGDEANFHVNLLADMESGLDEAHSGLASETRRAAQLREDQSVWRLQLVVAGLSILLVLLILMGLSP